MQNTVEKLELLLNCTVQDWNSLQSINLNNSNITSLPPEVDRWTSATHISLYGNQLTSLPDAVSGWSSATCINLYGNQLTFLPDAVSGWSSATHIYLGGNRLTSLPDGVSGWSSATYIFLSNNQLSSLPDTVHAWISVTHIFLSGNPILFIDNNLCDKCVSVGGFRDLFFSLENKKKIQNRYACKIQKIYRRHNEKRNNAAVIIQRRYIDHFYRVHGPWYNKTLQAYLTFK
uniref:Leucine rich repeat protein n=1 Tax=Marseillevirus LCMAC201 TaxID=2506605 RepID=A0A481YYR9_9VIRU|nr:MAG: leucine rich repeat protein [Marseillevirus LCMAC201]